MTKMKAEIISSNNNDQTKAVEVFQFNPFDPEFHADPYPIYQRLRIQDPVHKSFDVWVLTRYADVNAVLHDSRFGSNQLPKRIKDKKQYLQTQKNLDTLARALSKFFFFIDPPDHTRLRGLVSKAFSLSVVESMRPKVQEIVDGLIAKVQDRGNMDIIADFARPLPVIVISKMLGVPTEEHSKLHQWSNELSRVLDPLLSLEAYERINQVAVEFSNYFRDLITERENRPKEDLISALIAARDEGNKLNEDELVSICMLLFATGEETTVNTIGNGMLALLHHSDQMEKLKQEPTIIQSAVEEILRYDSPVQQTVRMATENVDIGGKTIRAGEKVFLSLGSANRDPAEFTDPDQLNLTRCENRHLAFGDGIHYCLGAALARVQAQVAINTLVQQLPSLKLNTDKLEWQEHIALRGLKSLSVIF